MEKVDSGELNFLIIGFGGVNFARNKTEAEKIAKEELSIAPMMFPSSIAGAGITVIEIKQMYKVSSDE